MIQVSQLWIYPFKSARGISLPNTRFDAEGMLNDRRLLAVDAGGKFLTARRYPELLQLSCTPQDGGWLLNHPKSTDSLLLKPEEMDDKVGIRGYVWNDVIRAQDAGSEAADWLSQVLDIPAQIALWQKQSRRAGKYDLETSFADAAPLLITSDATVDQTCDWAGIKADVRRFRPNIVVSGVEAFAEDQWNRIRIGEVEFEILDACERCILTTRDPDSGDKHPNRQPLQTLKEKHSGSEGEPLLGVNAVMRVGDGDSVISVGDEVEILS